MTATTTATPISTPATKAAATAEYSTRSLNVRAVTISPLVAATSAASPHNSGLFYRASETASETVSGFAAAACATVTAAVSMLPNITTLRARLRFIAATLPRELSQKTARKITIPSVSLHVGFLTFGKKAVAVAIEGTPRD
jgi:hypothetical protein